MENLKNLFKYMRVFDIIFGLFCIPFGMILFLCIVVFATALWLPYFMWQIISTVFLPSRDNDDFIEFIFICYGLAIMCLIAPFGIIESAIKK